MKRVCVYFSCILSVCFVSFSSLIFTALHESLSNLAPILIDPNSFIYTGKFIDVCKSLHRHN